jgi:hypothetical protein
MRSHLGRVEQRRGALGVAVGNGDRACAVASLWRHGDGAVRWEDERGGGVMVVARSNAASDESVNENVDENVNENVNGLWCQ